MERGPLVGLEDAAAAPVLLPRIIVVALQRLQWVKLLPAHDCRRLIGQMDFEDGNRVCADVGEYRSHSMASRRESGGRGGRRRRCTSAQ